MPKRSRSKLQQRLIVFALMSTMMFLFQFTSMSMVSMIPTANYEHRTHQSQKDETTVLSFPPKSSRISFTLHRNRPYRNIFNPYVNCLKKSPRRDPLPAAMTVESPGVLDFTTYWSTDLKTLVMGDSVGIQLSETLEEVVSANVSHRSVLRESWRGHVGLHVSAPVQGGGAVAGWRILHFLLARKHGSGLPNHCCGGWLRSDVHQLLTHTYSVPEATASNTASGISNSTIQSFDVMIFRISHGWNKLDIVSRENIEETIRLASSLFGVKTLIFLSLPFINNIVAQADLDLLHVKRKLLQEVAHNWTMQQQLKRQRDGMVEGVETVLVLDMAKLTDELITWNANLLGMDTTTSDYWLGRTTDDKNPNVSYTHHTAQVCAKVPPKRQRGKPNKCALNSISVDGMHWCFETIGGRLFAGMACQLACVYSNHNATEPSVPAMSTKNDTFIPMSSPVEDCAQKCNDKYMGLQPVDPSEILD